MPFKHETLAISLLCKFTGSKERSVGISFPICNDMPDLMVSVVSTSSYSGELMHFLSGFQMSRT